MLARLDNRELTLEHTRLVSEREQSVRKQRQALADQDRGAMMVAAAQIAESDAQIALIDDKLSRATLTAPFDGVVVSGDLSQLLGTPVEQGKLLFQIAPLDSYRVIYCRSMSAILLLSILARLVNSLCPACLTSGSPLRSSRSPRWRARRRAETSSAWKRICKRNPSGCGQGWKASARSPWVSAS